MPKTHRTPATKNEVCINFLRGHCPYKSQCRRIHPRHKSRPSKVQLLTGTVQDQECTTTNKATRMEVPFTQGRSLNKCLLQTDVVPEFVVKPPRKGQSLASLESTISQVCLRPYSIAPLICYTATHWTIQCCSDERGPR
jgi:Zinc finger C-x8-C-x5-C-x3-H type (and similar)